MTLGQDSNSTKLDVTEGTGQLILTTQRPVVVGQFVFGVVTTFFLLALCLFFVWLVVTSRFNIILVVVSVIAIAIFGLGIRSSLTDLPEQAKALSQGDVLRLDRQRDEIFRNKQSLGQVSAIRQVQVELRRGKGVTYTLQLVPGDSPPIYVTSGVEAQRPDITRLAERVASYIGRPVVTE